MQDSGKRQVARPVPAGSQVPPVARPPVPPPGTGRVSSAGPGAGGEGAGRAGAKRPAPPAPATARPIPVARVASGGSAGPRTGAGGPRAGAGAKAAGMRPIPVPGGNGVAVQAATGEEEPVEATEAAVRSAPPWLVSAVVHMALLVLLGLMVMGDNSDRQVEIHVFSDQLGDPLLDDDLFALEIDAPEIEDPAFAMSEIMDPDPLASPPELDLSIADWGFLGDIEAPSIGLALTGRTEGSRAALLAARGGTKRTEAAVQLGLQWLARQQDRRTGLWRLDGPYSDGANQENPLAATAMALLAFQGSGNTHQSGKYQRNVARALEALLEMQDEDGNFFREGSSNHRLYSQAQATIALCELYGMTQDESLREPAQRALDYAARIQTPGMGGWRYIPRQDADTSVTGWFVMAFQSGLMSGLEVGSPTLEAINGFLDSVTEDGIQYAYQPNRAPTLTMTAEALLCRQYLGWERDDSRLQEGALYLLENPVDYEADENVYYWYYATQVLNHMGGEFWDPWNLKMRERIPDRQVQDGPERGSWDPGNDRWGVHGGRLYTTCLSICNLQVYYRHLPIYRH